MNLPTSIKLGVTLSSGSTKGIASLGFLKSFERHKIPIDIITGASAGAITATALAVGMSIDEMIRIVQRIKIKDIMSLSLKDDTGILSFERFFNIIQSYVGDKEFKDLGIRLGLVANNVETCEEVYFTEGNVWTALTACFGISGLYPVSQYRNLKLVDGGFLNPLPVNLARHLGANIIIAVDIGSHRRDNFSIPNPAFGNLQKIFRFVYPQILLANGMLTLLRRTAGLGHTNSIQRCIEEFKPDILVQLDPKLKSRGIDRIRHSDIKYRDLLIEIGEEMGEEAITTLKDVIVQLAK